MKQANLLLFAGALVGFTGCASTPHYALNQPVGPAPSARASTPGNGVLEVYSARQPAQLDPNYAVFFEGESFLKNLAYLPAHTDYNIYAADGKLLKHVQNSHTLGDPQPAQVVLPPGHYQVEAETQTSDGNIATVSLTVVIAPMKTTAVHLDGGWAPPPNSPGSELVALPSGQIAGWRADLPTLHAASSAPQNAADK